MVLIVNRIATPSIFVTYEEKDASVAFVVAEPGGISEEMEVVQSNPTESSKEILSKE